VTISAPNNPTEIASGLPPLATTAREITEPVPKHNRGIPFLAMKKRVATHHVNVYTLLTKRDRSGMLVTEV
jgi:hypothetical protein